MEEFVKKFRLYIVIALQFAIILFMAQCLREHKGVKINCGEFKTITFDTIKTRHVDTIKFIDTIPKYVKVEIHVPVYDTLDHTNKYISEFEDSLIKGSIISKVDGVLVNQDFTYTPKFPQYIKITDTIQITKSIVEQIPNKVKLFVGVEAGGNQNTFNLSPTIMLEDKKERIYSYKYNLINQTHNVGFAIKLKLK